MFQIQYSHPLKMFKICIFLSPIRSGYVALGFATRKFLFCFVKRDIEFCFGDVFFGIPFYSFIFVNSTGQK